MFQSKVLIQAGGCNVHTISPKQGAAPKRGRGVFIRTHEARIGGDNQHLEHRIVILGQLP